MINVLLVEDDESHARLIRRAFKSSEVQADIKHVRRLQQMLYKILERRPDVLILDYLLPDGRGPSPIDAELGFTALPTVLITSPADEHVISEAACHGITNLVQKSIVGFEKLPDLAQAVVSLSTLKRTVLVH